MSAKSGMLEGFTAVYERGEQGWIVASCPEIPGAVSQGRTMGEARENLKDAIRMLQEVRREKAERERQEAVLKEPLML